MSITIIIISYKSLSKLEKCLSTIGDAREIFIIENSDNVQFKEIIENKYKNCKIIINNKNLGYGSAANIAFKEINTQYAILLNTDTRINKNQILNIENEIIDCKGDFALASPIYDDLIDFNKNKSFDKNFKVNQLDLNTKDNKTKVDLVKGCALVVNLKKFEKKNIFDENFFFFFEEIDLCKKVKKMNENVFVFNKIKIAHDSAGAFDSETNGNYSDFRNWNYYWSRFYYHKKHYGYLSSLVVHFSKLIRFFISSIVFFFFSKSKFKMNKSRFLGLFCSIIGIKSSISDKILNKTD
jgi:GT2 family glycosyltransferase